MTTSNASAPNRRLRRSARNATIGAVAVISLGTAWMSTGGSAGANRTDDPVERTELVRSPEFDAAVERFAAAHGLSGLSPASLSSGLQDPGCHGLSLASATGCTASELGGR
jgi:hypothetical protein